MFDFFKKTKSIITHDGKFHADDIFAVAIITIVLDSLGEPYKIIRTRDEKIITSGDYVVDVGTVHDSVQNRFDHHQIGGAGERQNGVPYAAVGLVWKTYGELLAGSFEAASLIDSTLITSIDADDNAFSLIELKHGIRPYRLQEALYAFRPTWKEEQNFDEAFLKLIPLAKDILLREIIHAKHSLEASTALRKAYMEASDKRIVMMETNYPFQATLTQFTEPLYVVAKRPTNGWKVEAVAKGPNTFELRQPFPFAWAGLRDAELAKVSGVPDAIFCHNGRFLVVAKTREGALALAQKALLG